MKHYTVLGVHDAAGALAKLPDITAPAPDKIAAASVATDTDVAPADHHHQHQQSEHLEALRDATTCAEQSASGEPDTVEPAAHKFSVRATLRDEARGETRTRVWCTRRDSNAKPSAPETENGML